MSNNADTKVRSESLEEHDWVNTVLVFASFASFAALVMGILIGSGFFHKGSVTPSSVAATPVSESWPAMWDVRAQSYGREVDDVGNLGRAHAMRVFVNNLECPEGQMLRCCHAEVYFDGQLDLAETRTLCEELPVSLLQALDVQQLGSSSAALRSYANNRRFDQLYQRHYGHGPNDRNLYIMYSNDH